MTITIISPTGKGMRRSDVYGSGAYHAPRGSRKHEGVDYVSDPGQDIVAPITGKIIRVAHPYANALQYEGCVLQTSDVSIKMFYFKPDRKLIGKYVQQGQVIGKAQDISSHYPPKHGNRMVNHIHLGITWINPDALRSQT